MQRFHPEKTIYVDAKSHGPDVKYKISYGIETWDSEDISPQVKKYKHVFKIQMEFNGKVYGRVVPSFPKESGELEKVLEALQELNKSITSTVS